MNTPQFRPGDVVLYWRDSQEQPDGTVKLIEAEVFRVVRRAKQFENAYVVKTLFNPQEKFHWLGLNARLMGRIEPTDEL